MKDKKQAAIGFIFITLLIDVIGLGIIIPVMPSLIEELIHGSLSDAAKYSGWLMLSYSVMQFFFAPIIGGLSDKYGRRPVLLASLLAFGLDYLLLAFAPTIGWLFLGRIIAGITGASFSTAQAYIADISTDNNRAQNFGMVGAAFGLGFIIGPMLGGLLGEFGSRVPFLVSAGVALLNFVYGYFILPESLSKENRRPFNWKRANPIGTFNQIKVYPIVMYMMGVMFFIYLAGHSLQSTWTFIMMEKFKWTKATVGYSLGIVGLAVALVQGLLIRFINPKLGDERSIYIGFTIGGAGMLLWAFATQTWMIFAITFVYCLSGIAMPALQSIMSKNVASNAQGELQGALASTVSVTSIIGPLMMTYIFSYFSSSKAAIYFPTMPFVIAAAFFAISILGVFYTLNKFRNKEAS
nr:TCR/Tet family MFS transporter [Bacteroidota bacterium]